MPGKLEGIEKLTNALLVLVSSLNLFIMIKVKRNTSPIL